MTRITAAAVVATLFLASTPAFAAEESPAASLPLTAAAAPTLSRPAILPALYISYATLQAFDVYSTRQALARGGREANPLMQQVVGNQAAFLALKASATVGTIVAAERLWKKNKKTAAVAVLITSNAVAAVVAARNARALRSRR